MRTDFVIDDTPMQETLKATGLKTGREALEPGPRKRLRRRRQESIRRFRGRLDRQGDLNAMRTDK